MNPALTMLLTVGIIALWFLLSFTFKPLGKFIYRIGKDAVDIITEDDKKENEK